MTIIFGSYEFELRRKVRVSGAVFDCLFAPAETSFEAVKTILETKSNTKTIEINDGDDITTYSNYTVLKKLEYCYGDGGETLCHAMLQTADIQTQVNECADEISETSMSVDDVITEMIPAILEELKSYVDEKIAE